VPLEIIGKNLGLAHLSALSRTNRHILLNLNKGQRNTLWQKIERAKQAVDRVVTNFTDSAACPLTPLQLDELGKCISDKGIVQHRDEVLEKELKPIDDWARELHDGFAGRNKSLNTFFSPLWPRITQLPEALQPLQDMALHTLSKHITRDLVGGNTMWLAIFYDDMLSCDRLLNGQSSSRLKDLCETVHWFGAAPEETKRDAWNNFLEESKRRSPIFHSIEMQGIAWHLPGVTRDLRCIMFDDILSVAQSNQLPQKYARQLGDVLLQIVGFLPREEEASRHAQLMQLMQS
jgi:hypothetical protein